ncbi:MAG TPA: GGDEF domain-containing protein [Burkholderiales bacterium]|nr:GGDEF domain-containing protein [Burkholderiales bacterium]
MNTPADIAREALRQLATRRVPPTPDNYSTFYRQIAGDPEEPQETAAPAAIAVQPQPAGAAAPGAQPELQELLAHVLESLRATVARDSDLVDDLNDAARAARRAATGELVTALTERLHALMPRLRQAATENEAVHEGTARLLQLMLRTTREVASDNTTLDGLMQTLDRLLQQKLDMHTIEEAERSLRDVLMKHGVLKQGLDEVKNTLKEMASRFVDRLGELSVSTGEYHDKLVKCNEQIARTEDIRELNWVLTEVMRDTKLMQAGADSSRRELIAAQQQVEAAQSRIKHLETDLATATRKMREDSLTGMLNRHGVEDDFQREAARADRDGKPLCAALLDVDNFKQLNDVHGHQGGDQALVYLATVMKETARKGDIIARFGGEEFLILLPNTELEAARACIVRLQRALTRHLFLHNNERLLITFSCGVAQRVPRETREALLERADKALYRAKRAGKNRVYTAD